jgi:SSS family transporter
MGTIDWTILWATLIFITGYGIYKSHKQQNLEGYLLGGRSLPWYQVMFSVIATQASAITFLSAPGQAYTDGMRFIQFYFGMPLAMIVVCAVFLPQFSRLNMFTAYQYLEKRFNVQTRALAAFLFLMLRGLSAGLTIYAPAIILSSLLGWHIFFANLMMGGLVIVYTMTGGSKAVAVTQLQQMIVISIGMLIAGLMIVRLMPEEVGFTDALHIAGCLNKLNAITTSFDFSDKYNIWSGLLGGFFLSLSYFGTDQSQVGRYLSGRSISESRIGLLMTGFVKIPMQFLILLIGALLVVFYQFNTSPVFFNQSLLNHAKQTAYICEITGIEQAHEKIAAEKKIIASELAQSKDNIRLKELLFNLNESESGLRRQAKQVIKQAIPMADTNDTNYIFLDFVMRYMPQGLIGLLIAVIFCASWSSTSSELNALASTFVIDVYKRLFNQKATEEQYVFVSKAATLMWGIFAIGVAQFASAMGSLIEAVNILGSLFYGTILGIFLTAFFLKKVIGNSVFIAAVISQITVMLLYAFDVTAFLWLNLIGCLTVMMLSIGVQFLLSSKRLG